MAECVDVPTHFWVDAEVLFNELAAKHQIVDKVIEIGSCFVWVYESTIYYFDLAILNKLFD